jgi:ribonuclease HI
MQSIKAGYLNGKRKLFEKKKNEDLWIEFLGEYRKHAVKFVWIKGHNDHPENERCDILAVEASHAPDLPTDRGYLESLDKED